MVPPGAGHGGFELLPTEALASVLSHVPQRRRLQTLARVSKAWAAAATAGSTDATFDLLEGSAGSRNRRAAAFGAWVANKSPPLTSLAARGSGVNAYNVGTLRLPCERLAQLRSLDVSDLMLDLHSASSASTSAQARFPALRALKLELCTLSPGTASLLQIPAEPSAADANPEGSALAEYAAQQARTVAAAQRATLALLQQLPLLSTVHLASKGLNDASLAPLSAMQGLCDLSLCSHGSEGMTARDMATRFQGLTALSLQYEQAPREHMYSVAALPASPPIAWPAPLLRLQLDHISLDPPVLEALTQLQHLALVSCRFSTSAHQSMLSNTLISSTRALMTALRGMQQLQSLHVHADQGLEAYGKDDLKQFAALTASCCLTSLVLGSNMCQPLPRGALHHMLKAGKQLPHLKTLELVSPYSAVWDGVNSHYWCLEAADVARISTTCPNLERLLLCSVLRHVKSTPVLSALGRLQRRLTQLSALTVADSTGFVNDDAAAALGQLTGLTELRILCAPHLTDCGLDGLQALQQLRRLEVCHALLSQTLAPRGVGGYPMWLDYDDEFEDSPALELTADAEDPGAPSVCHQLAALLDQSPVVRHMRTHRLRQRLAELEPQHAAAAEELQEVGDQLAATLSQLQEARTELDRKRPRGARQQQQLQA